MKHHTMAAAVATFGLAVGGVVAGAPATTFAQFSATAKAAESRAGAATVALGLGGGAVALGYTDLKPGGWRVVQLTVTSQGSVPADVSLAIAPSGSPALCVQRDGRWKSRPSGAVTVAVGSEAPVSYCDLLNGRTLPLASAVPPGSARTIDVTVMLSKDAKDDLRGLAETDVATVRASGGFTDEAVGTISIATAARDKVKTGERRENSTPTSDDVARKPDVNNATVPESAPQSPSETSGVSPARPAITLPAECERAGMRLDSFADVIVLGPDQHTWNAVGHGAGPFLVVGTDGDDEIVGSAGADCIVDGGGRDTLSGGAGNDVLIGGDGLDRIDGGPGDDWLFGGSEMDDLRGGGGIDRFDGGPDGASCDDGPDAAAAVHCQAPTTPASATVAGRGKEQRAEEATSPKPAGSTASAGSPTSAGPPASAPPASSPASAASAPPASQSPTAPASSPSPASPTASVSSPTPARSAKGANVAPTSAGPGQRRKPPAQAGSPGEGTASARSGVVGEGHPAASTQAGAPPSSPTTA